MLEIRENVHQYSGKSSKTPLSSFRPDWLQRFVYFEGVDSDGSHVSVSLSCQNIALN